ncbi:(Trans)glycosidase [Venustampulla echinocandica]|uniref:Endoglucanase EG-II n=1 Tax=Venustampulla echinocandica TaxID=2656787 RepID=A0A370TU45_9HELO|nr:(Trans)glycosidase [Venustampulla echinocandica]RDL39052.1 (Trans)glycosidase [Venustampulla echinocandica]
MKGFTTLSVLLASGAAALPGSSVARTSTGPLTARAVDANGTVKYAGINIAGFDFGCTTDGSQTLRNVNPPLQALGGPDGAGQMNHFLKDDHMNMFRLPVGWQYITGSNLGGQLNSGNADKYDQLVQACLRTGATCVIDIHNYARWDGKIIGQGGPTNAQFVNLWTQLATKYKSQANIAFGVMNEPHEVDIDKWADTVQQVVTAIRGTGATSQMILLPGNDYTSAGKFISNGSAAALAKVTNPDGSFTNLIFDVHKYLDSDNSGTHTECVTDNIADAFQPLADWLRTNNRQAINSETGGGNTASCAKYLCQQIAFLNANSDVYIGYIGWAAGAFGSTYELNETPTGGGNNWQDTSLVKACLARASG